MEKQMKQKYEFTGETQEVGNTTLHRIRALRDFDDVKAGDVGGWIESESNLSHDGNCWLSDNAVASGNARLADNARADGDACLCGNARASGNARISGAAWLFGNAVLSDNLVLCGYARLYGND